MDIFRYGNAVKLSSIQILMNVKMEPLDAVTFVPTRMAVIVALVHHERILVATLKRVKVAPLIMVAVNKCV